MFRGTGNASGGPRGEGDFDFPLTPLGNPRNPLKRPGLPALDLGRGKEALTIKHACCANLCVCCACHRTNWFSAAIGRVPTPIRWRLCAGLERNVASSEPGGPSPTGGLVAVVAFTHIPPREPRPLPGSGGLRCIPKQKSPPLREAQRWVQGIALVSCIREPAAPGRGSCRPPWGRSRRGRRWCSCTGCSIPRPRCGLRRRCSGH